MIPQPYPTPLRTGRGSQCDICKRTGIPVTEVITPHGKIIWQPWWHVLHFMSEHFVR